MKVKRAWFGIFLVLFCTGLAQAQVNAGLRGGVAQNTFTGRDIGSTSSLHSMVTGIFANISPGKLLALQPELLLVQKGAVRERRSEGLKETYKINYLEVPVLFKIQLPLGRIVYPHIFFGPYYAQKLNNTYAVTQLDNGTTYETAELNIKNNDYGTVAGAGIDIRGELLFLTIDTRYGWGLNSIDKGNAHRAGNDIRHRYLMWSAGIGVHFH